MRILAILAVVVLLCQLPTKDSLAAFTSVRHFILHCHLDRFDPDNGSSLSDECKRSFALLWGDYRLICQMSGYSSPDARGPDFPNTLAATFKSWAYENQDRWDIDWRQGFAIAIGEAYPCGDD